MAEWVRNARNFEPDEVLYYRVHESRVSQPFFVYDEVADMWAELEGEYSEHTQYLKDLMRPNVPEEHILKLSAEDIIKVANCGFAELVQTHGAE